MSATEQHAVIEQMNKSIVDFSKAAQESKQESGENTAVLKKHEEEFKALNEKLETLKSEQVKISQLSEANIVKQAKEEAELERSTEIQTFKSFLDSGYKGQKFDEFAKSSENFEVMKSLRTDIQERGGYMTGSVMGRMVESNIEELSTIAADCETVTLQQGSNLLEYPLDDDDIIRPSKVKEGSGTSTYDTETLGTVKVEPHNIFRKIRVTTNMIQDGVVNLEQWASSKAAKALALETTDDIFTGNGKNEAKGILSYTADSSTAYGAYTRNKLQQLNSGAAGDITDPDILDDLLALLKPMYWGNAKFYMHSTVLFKLLKLKDGENRPLIDPSYSNNPLSALAFRGMPISVQQQMPLASTGAKSILLADMSEAYVVVKKPGVQIIRDDVTQDNQVILKYSMRFGGQVKNFEAAKVLKLSA